MVERHDRPGVFELTERSRVVVLELEHLRPIGMEIGTIYNQPVQVAQSVNSFLVSLGQAVVMRLMPAFIWLSQRFDFGDALATSGEGMRAPVPYGIDVAPDGSVWFSQLNEHRIGRLPVLAEQEPVFDQRSGHVARLERISIGPPGAFARSLFCSRVHVGLSNGDAVAVFCGRRD